MNPPAQPSPTDDRIRALLEEADALGAWRFAAEHHGEQLRPTLLEPFIHHPERVAELVAEAGGTPEMVAAALLHDLLEDTPIAPADLEAEFGPEIAALVRALSDDPGIDDYETRKDALRDQVRAAGREAAVIYAADKLANAADLRVALGDVGLVAEARIKVPFPVRVRIWRDDLAMCSEVLGPHDLCDGLRDELDALERDREALGPTESII
jgi:(p)ppGpp synthase/HD superfamily hydrolase